MKGGYWIIHACFLFIFMGSCGLFYILREEGESPSTRVEKPRSCNVDTIPDIVSDEVADNRLEAFNQATALLTQEQKEKELQEEHNSFHFFAEEVSEANSDVLSEEADKVEMESEVALSSARRSAGIRESSVASSRPAKTVSQTYTEVSLSSEEPDSDDYYAQLEAQKIKEKKEREQRLYELYYGKKTVEEGQKEELSNHMSEDADDPSKVKSGSSGKGGFKTMGGSSSATQKGSIRAVVHGEQKNITASSQVKLRILDPIEVDGFSIPKNTIILGQASFRENRVNITIENIAYNNNVYPFRGTIYDQDGFQGIYFPDNLVNDVKKEAGSETTSSADIKLGSLSGIVSTGANAIVNATKSATSGAIRETKVTLPANYKLIIKTTK